MVLLLQEVQFTYLERQILPQQDLLLLETTQKLMEEHSTFQNLCKIFLFLFYTKFRIVNVLHDTRFRNNVVHHWFGADIAALNTNNTITLSDVDMSSPLANSSIYISSVSFKAMNLTIHDVFSLRNLGAGIYASDVQSIFIENSEFRNLTELKGGAIHIKQSENSKQSELSKPTVELQSVRFINCDSKYSICDHTHRHSRRITLSGQR